MPQPFKPSIKEQLISIAGSGEIMLGGAVFLGLLLFLAVSSLVDLSFIKSWQYEFDRNSEFWNLALVFVFVVCVLVFALLYIIFRAMKKPSIK